MNATMSSRWKAALRRLAVPLLAVLAVGCGGVGEEGTGIGTETTSVGMVQGLSDSSVTVNGVEYRRSAASVVSDGLDQPLTNADLRLGMWVELNGTVTTDGAGTTTDAVAERIRVRPAARGVVKDVSPDGATIGVLGSTVTLGNDTVRDGGGDATPLAAGDVVEVHGPLGAAAGTVAASRVERLPANPPAPLRYELRGRVSLIDTVNHTMLVGRRLVAFGSASVQLSQALAANQVVRVASTTAPVDGAAWVVEEVRSDGTLPANLGFLYTEGFVDALAAGPVFQLEDLPVDASNANGKARVTANGQRVAVFGPRVEGTLKARSVAPVVPGEPVVFMLVGPVTNFNGPGSFRVRGVQVDATTDEFQGSAEVRAGLFEGLRVRVDGVVRGRTLALRKVALPPPVTTTSP